MDLYRDIILDHFKHPHNFGVIDHATCSAHMHNTSCGDKIRMDIIISDDNTISDIRFSGEGCAISFASASILTDFVKGKRVADVLALTPEDLYSLVMTPLTPSRVKCALLPLEVLQSAVTTRAK